MRPAGRPPRSPVTWRNATPKQERGWLAARMRRMNKLIQGLLVAAAVAALSCTTAARAADVATGQPIDSVLCEPAESFVVHIHQHLDIIDHGKPIVIPGDIGRPGYGSLYP